MEMKLKLKLTLKLKLKKVRKFDYVTKFAREKIVGEALQPKK